MNPEMTNLSGVTMAELASFCIHKLARLEARFIILCHRAQAAGIDCSDLWDLHGPGGGERGAPVRLTDA